MIAKHKVNCTQHACKILPKREGEMERGRKKREIGQSPEKRAPAKKKGSKEEESTKRKSQSNSYSLLLCLP